LTIEKLVQNFTIGKRELPIAAVATMMKPKVADSTTTLSIMTYFTPKMPTKMSTSAGNKKSKSWIDWKSNENN